MKNIILLAICFVFVFPSIGLSGDMQWNWDREGHTTDGSMTFKDESNNPFETNVNPTSENVKINKSTAREAPVVYVQSGASSFDCSSMPVCDSSNINTEPICRVPGVNPPLCTHRTDLGRMQHSGYADYSKVGALEACMNLGPGWHLPSLTELHALRTNKGAIGGFENDGRYWSSNEITIHSFFVRFSNGNENDDNKYDTCRVRCVRRF